MRMLRWGEEFNHFINRQHPILVRVKHVVKLAIQLGLFSTVLVRLDRVSVAPGLFHQQLLHQELGCINNPITIQIVLGQK